MTTTPTPAERGLPDEATPTFEVGCRVQECGDFVSTFYTSGDTGRVVKIDRDGDLWVIWDNPKDDAQGDHGWCIPRNNCKLIEAAPSAPAEACPCGESTCTESWEPGCGLGRSEEHAKTAPEPLAQAQSDFVSPYPVAPMGHGLVTIGEGHISGVRALIFGNRGSGVFGEAGEGNRRMADGETICAITFATPESVELLRLYVNAIADSFDAPDSLDKPRQPLQFPPNPPQPSASVGERARELLAKEYRGHGWHEDAGRLCMGGDVTSFVEDDALRVIARLIEEGDEDTHVITEMGRLLAAIAITLKGPEPAGTAWSYHDLPSMLASVVAEPLQVAAEMKAWAHTKMAENGSSRRDKMMVAEWAKRLLPEASFPIKDFDIEGMSITKEAAREAVQQVAIESALTTAAGGGE